MPYPKRLTLRTVGDPILTEKATPVTEFGAALEAVANQMIDLMHKNNGVGLAGPQAGLSLRLFVMDVTPPEDEEGVPPVELSEAEKILLPMMPVTLVNPQIISYGTETNDFEEGCLSYPKTYATVTRPNSLTIHATLLDGREILAECRGFLARVIQHEYDHLDGITFPDRLTPELRDAIQPRINQLIAAKNNKFLTRLLRRKG